VAIEVTTESRNATTCNLSDSAPIGAVSIARHSDNHSSASSTLFKSIAKFGVLGEMDNRAFGHVEIQKKRFVIMSLAT
jgi:hypothetical protein